MEPFKINFPEIVTGQVYTFTTDYGIDYEVRFARKTADIFYTIVAFGVLNEEYEGEEYVITNKGDALRVMTTITVIIRTYLVNHPSNQVFEFTGILKEGEQEKESQRTKLYLRYLPQIFKNTIWRIAVSGNQIICTKIDYF